MDTSELQKIKQRYNIVGNSDGLNHALDVALQVAPTDLSVLIIVEEDGALVGNAEVSLAFANGSGEGSLLMSEEFAVNGSLRNASTVDGEIFLSAAWRIVVNHPWNDFLTHTALADDEHGKIGRRYL